MDSYVINGGKPLKGRVVLSGAKNVALKTIIASLMFESEVVLENIPRINDVLDLIELIKILGARAEFIGKNELKIDGRFLKNNCVDMQYGSKIRVSFMLFAPLLYRFGECSVPNPGGCRIGARPIDRIISGMKALGIDVVYNPENGFYKAKLDGFPKGKYHFVKPSHTGTELLMMLGTLTKEGVVIGNAANEPEIDDLIKMLKNAGANIEKTKNNLVIKKSGKLKQKEHYKIMPDRNEFVTYAILAAASRGNVNIGPIKKELIVNFLDVIEKTGVIVEYGKDDYYRFSCRSLIEPTNIETSPHPGFMTDWQPNWAILMTQAKGKSTIIERVFENRFSYVKELKKLGAKIDFFEQKVEDPKNYYFFNYKKEVKYNQSIEIEGPVKLHGGVLDIADLRAGASLALAALISKGESIVKGASILERGYEDFIGKVKKIGGEIKKI